MLASQYQPYCVRLPNCSDIEHVARIEQETQFQPWRREDFDISFKTATHQWWLISETPLSQPLGYCICQKVAEEAEILTIAVALPWQGQGLGEILLTQVMTQLKQMQIHYVFLEVREHNTPAIGLYEKLGFNLYGNRRQYYRNPAGDCEDALLFACHLEEGR